MGSFTDQLRGFEDKTQREIHEVVTKVILEIATRLILRSPVDTGRFRSAWSYSVSPYAETPPVEIVDKSGGSAMARVAEAIPAKPAGQVHFIVNNLPYAQRLEHGWSGQAPNGMVALTVMEFPEIVARAVASVKS